MTTNTDVLAWKHNHLNNAAKEYEHKINMIQKAGETKLELMDVLCIQHKTTHISSSPPVLGERKQQMSLPSCINGVEQGKRSLFHNLLKTGTHCLIISKT